MNSKIGNLKPGKKKNFKMFFSSKQILFVDFQFSLNFFNQHLKDLLQQKIEMELPMWPPSPPPISNKVNKDSLPNPLSRLELPNKTGN